MEIKKSPKADLEGKKGVFFEIGLTLALAVLLFAFEWKSSTEQVTPFQTPAEEQIEDEIIPITQQMLKPPPPPPPAPKLTDLIDIVEDDTNIDDDLEILDAEDQSENQVIENVVDFGEYGEENTGESEIFQVVEDMPSFPGGNVSKWIAEECKISGSGHGKRYSGESFHSVRDRERRFYYRRKSSERSRCLFG